MCLGKDPEELNGFEMELDEIILAGLEKAKRILGDHENPELDDLIEEVKGKRGD